MAPEEWRLERQLRSPEKNKRAELGILKQEHGAVVLSVVLRITSLLDSFGNVALVFHLYVSFQSSDHPTLHSCAAVSFCEWVSKTARSFQLWISSYTALR